MVTVVWTKQALDQRRLLYKNGVLEFEMLKQKMIINIKTLQR